MKRTTNVVYNAILHGFLAYLLGRLVRGHRTGIRLGVAVGTLWGVATWVIYGRAEASGTIE